MVKHIILGIVFIILFLVTILFMLFYRSDLSRDELKQYINHNSKFITLPNGANVHYRDEGNPDGKVIVMIHGGFGSLHNWQGWVGELKEDYRLISMDLLGHGLTGASPSNVYTRHAQRDMLYQLLKALNISKYTLAGNSFGGGIALEVALEYPMQLEGLILVNSEGVPNSEDGYDVSLFTNSVAVAPEDPNFTKISFSEKLAAKFISANTVKSVLKALFANQELLTDEYVDSFARILRYKGNREAQVLMFSQGLWLVSKYPEDLKPRLQEISSPTLIMTGAEDTLVPMFVNHTFKQLISNSQLVVIDNAGHMPMIEKPIESAYFVKRFMNNLIQNEQ